MEEAQFIALDEQRQKDIAVAYLLKNKNEVPEDLKKYVKKLDSLESSAFSIMMAVNEAKKTIASLGPRSEQLAGAMGAMADLIIEELTNDQVLEFGLKYQAPESKSSTPDMAGATASGYNNTNPINLQNGKV